MKDVYVRKNLVFEKGFSLQKLKNVAQKEGWVLSKEVVSSESEPFQTHWRHEPLDLYLVYVEDDRIKVNYLEARAAVLNDALEYLASILPLESKEQVLKLAEATSGDEKKQAIKNLGVMFSYEDFDPECFKVLVGAMQAEEKEIFIAALEAVPYLKWRQFETVLFELIKTEMPVKQYAEKMLEAMRNHEWGY